MSEKREILEGVYSIDPQDPRDMAKARLPEFQSPAVERILAATTPQGSAIMYELSAFCGSYLPLDGDKERPHSRG
jgi:hypothetical protein